MWKQGEQKVCIDCKVLLTEDNWPKALQKSYHYRCRDCFNKGGKAWKKNNRAKITQRERERMASDPVYLEHKRKLARDCHNRHREAYNQKSKEHYYKHTADSKERNKIWKAKHGNYHRNWGLLKRYGLTLEQYGQMADAQNNVCAICGNSETSKDKWGNIKLLAVDHNHITGEIRGLLCHNCNVALGNFNVDESLEDALDILASASSYLQQKGIGNVVYNKVA